MKKRGLLTLISIISLLILIPNAYSIYEESIYSGTVEDRDVVDIDGSLFEFRIDPISSKVYVEIDVSAVIIASGECKIKGNFDICISNVSFSYRDHATYTDVYKTLVNVYKIKSKVDITNTIEKNKLLIGEEVTGELAIENTADIVAEDLTATIKIPSSILVTETEGCKKTFDSVIVETDVHPKQIKKCTYKIKGLSGSDFKITADVNYFNGVEKINTTSNTISGKVYNYSLKISSELNKIKFNIEEKLDLTINIENTNDEYDLSVTSFTITIPKGLLLIKKPKDTVSNNMILTWSGTMESNEKKSFVVELQSRITGNYSVPTEVNYKIGKFSRTAKSISNIEVYCDCPYIKHDFSQGIAVPEQRVSLKAFIVNPSQVHEFRNIQIKYLTNIPNIQDFSTAYAKISPFGSIKIFDSPIITPNLGEIYHLNITAAYESSTSQIFVVKDNIEIKIPEEKEEIRVKEQEVKEEIAEEQQEVDEVEETGLDTEKTEETIDAAEKTTEEEIPVTTIKEEKKPFKAYTIVAFIAAIFFILIVLIIFKRRKSRVRAVKKKELKAKSEEERHNIKEFLSIIFRKREKVSEKPKHRPDESEFEALERQIRELGETFEKEKQTENRSIFRKK